MTPPLPRASVAPSFFHLTWKSVVTFAVVGAIFVYLLERCGVEMRASGIAQEHEGAVGLPLGSAHSDWIDVGGHDVRPGDRITIRYRTGGITNDYYIDDLTVLEAAPPTIYFVACGSDELPCPVADDTAAAALDLTDDPTGWPE